SSTALPRREVISMGVRSSLTCSMRGNRFLRASLAVIDTVDALLDWYKSWYHSWRLAAHRSGRRFVSVDGSSPIGTVTMGSRHRRTARCGIADYFRVVVARERDLAPWLCARARPAREPVIRHGERAATQPRPPARRRTASSTGPL